MVRYRRCNSKFRGNIILDHSPQFITILLPEPLNRLLRKIIHGKGSTYPLNLYT